MHTPTCEAVRQESAASMSAPVTELSEGARTHLTGCVDCALALADEVASGEPQGSSHGVPRAGSGSAHLAPRDTTAAPLCVAASVASEDTRGLGWLTSAAWPSRRGLLPALCVAFAAAYLFGYPARVEESLGKGRDTVWRAIKQEVVAGLADLTASPKGEPLVAALHAGATHGDGANESPLPAAEAAFDPFRPWYRAGPDPGETKLDLLRHAVAARAGLPAGREGARARRTLLYLTLQLDRWSASGDAGLDGLRKELWAESSADLCGAGSELAWKGLALAGGFLPAGEKPALCERVLALRWELFRAHGPRARGVPAMWDGACELHAGHALPSLSGETTELLGSLAAARMLHAWHQGWGAALGALADGTWLVPNVVWLFRSTIPGLAGCCAFTMLWLAVVAFRRRRVLSEGLGLHPDRGKRTLVGAAALIAPALPAVLMLGGPVWWMCRGAVSLIFGRGDSGPDIGDLIRYPMVMLYDRDMVASPGPSMLAWLAVTGLLAMGLTLVQRRLLVWVDPAGQPGWKAVLVPLVAIGLLTWKPANRGDSGVMQPLVLGLVLLAALPWMRRQATVRERRLAALVTGTCLGLFVTNALGHLGEVVGGLFAQHLAVIAAAMGCVLVVMPAGCGYLLAHLPPSTWRQQRRIALIALVVGPALFGSLVLRATLSTAADHQQSMSAIRLFTALFALVAVPLLALLVGARSSPPGAAALRDPGARPGRVGPWADLLERSPWVFGLGLVASWLIGHLGLLSTRISLF